MDWKSFWTEPSFWILIGVIILFSGTAMNLFSKIINKILFMFKKKNDEYSISQPSKEIEKTIKTMKTLKMGGTFIIDFDDDTNNFIVDSITIDSKVNSKIMESFFHKKSPLHDGAIVIKKDRIVSASAFITKLSENKKLPIAFGTRHRSALGISEVTSSLVIVISEETQKITFFSKGTWKRVAMTSLYNEILKNWKE